MAVIRYNQKELKLSARLMRAKAEEDGKLGMLMVGNTDCESGPSEGYKFS
ncbi:hypothetical protein [Virgibacillus subterraneus]